MLGARIGTMMKTMKVSDMTRAICRPPYRSRMMERAMTMLAAAMPCANRHASRVSKLRAKPTAAAAMT